MTKVPEHVRAAAIEAVWATEWWTERCHAEATANQALAVVEAHLDAYCDASNPAWTQPQQLYRFKGRDE